jgi:hypothetical protein
MSGLWADKRTLLFGGTEAAVTATSYSCLVECLGNLRSKKSCIWEDFYSTDAMVNREWMQSGYELRHMMTRLSLHGYHFKLWKTKNFHEPGPECICERWKLLRTISHNVLQATNWIPDKSFVRRTKSLKWWRTLHCIYNWVD